MCPSTIWGITKSGEMGNQRPRALPHITQGQQGLRRAELWHQGTDGNASAFKAELTFVKEVTVVG